jgi:rRNA maturation endonuclease Nob1
MDFPGEVERLLNVAREQGLSIDLFHVMRSIGWAPGDYVIRCHGCDQQTTDCDKRARLCKSCALDAVASLGDEARELKQ